MTGSDASSPLTARDASNRSQVLVDCSVKKASRGSLAALAFVHLRKRPDFLRVGKGARFHVRTFSLQMAKASLDPSEPGDAAAEPAPPRFGFTVTRKTGGSVERNRIRRRLREALRRAALLEARPGTDYVIVARREALQAPFDKLIDDLSRAMRLIDDKAGSKSGQKPGAPRKP